MRSETGQMEGFKPPREDLNSPDLYIPGKKISLAYKSDPKKKKLIRYFG
jgi:hypothetical protein